MKFDLLAGGQEICEILTFQAVILFLFLASITIGDGCFQFQDNKVSLSKLLDIIMKTIFQPG